jgi:hypothetical protein
LTPERLFALVLAHSPGFAEPIGGGKPTWTILEAAWGASGIPNDLLSAFLWRYARDGTALAALQPLLVNEAQRLSKRERWPKTIDGIPYLLDLVELVLAEEQLSELDRERLRQRLEYGWGEATWNRYLAPKHRAIGAILDRLCVDAHEHIARRIRDHDD